MFSFVTCFQNNSGFVYCILNSLNGYKNQNTQCSDLLPTMSLSKSSIRTPSSWCVSSFMSTNLRNSLLFSWFIISIILPSCDLDKIVDSSFCETNWKIGMLHFLLFIWSLFLTSVYFHEHQLMYQLTHRSPEGIAKQMKRQRILQ